MDLARYVVDAAVLEGPTHHIVGARGFEPLTSSVSRKRSTPELSARSSAWYRRAEAGTGIEPV